MFDPPFVSASAKKPRSGNFTLAGCVAAPGCCVDAVPSVDDWVALHETRRAGRCVCHRDGRQSVVHFRWQQACLAKPPPKVAVSMTKALRFRDHEATFYPGQEKLSRMCSKTRPVDLQIALAD